MACLVKMKKVGREKGGNENEKAKENGRKDLLLLSGATTGFHDLWLSEDLLCLGALFEYVL